MRISDWSSDVCSSDLRRAVLFALARAGVGSVTILNRSPLKAAGLLATFGLKGEAVGLDSPLPPAALLVNASRSEERRVGKACVSPCRSRWSPDTSKKKI